MKGVKRMDIILINLKSGDFRMNSFPLGLAYISSALDQHNVKIYDLNLDNQTDLYLEISRKKNLIIGISCYTGMLSQASELAQTIKCISNNCTVVIGGYHASAEYRYIMENYNEFDIAIIGRGEKAFSEIVACIQNGKSLSNVASIAFRIGNDVVVNKTSVNDFYKSIIPNRSKESLYFEKMSDEKISCISTMRGCYHKCSFCSIAANDYISTNSYDTLREDVKNIVDNGANSLYFSNSDFLCSQKHVDMILEVLCEFPQIRSFKFSTRADSIIKNQSCLEELFKAGCNSIEIGIESFSDSQLKRYNKGVQAFQNIQCHKILSEFYAKYKFRMIHELIPFDPWVTLSELRATIDFYIENSFDYIELEPWLFTKLMLYPNTDIYEKAKEDKLISENSHIEVPFWNFLSIEVNTIFNVLYTYKLLVLPEVIKLRKYILNCILSSMIKNKDKFVYSRIYGKLSKISLILFYNLVHCNYKDYGSILDQTQAQLDEYKTLLYKGKVK